MSDPLRSTRFLRRLLEQGVLRILGGASLAAGVVSVPLLLACGGCPPPFNVVHAIPAAGPDPSGLGEEERQAFCYEACGGVTDDCYLAVWHPDGQMERTRRNDGVGTVMPNGNAGESEQPPQQQERALICVENVQLECQGIGRNPSLLTTHSANHDGSLGDHFARIAHLEAAAVIAFVELSFELETHGAPIAFVEAAQRSAVEETRHHRDTAALARALGSKVAQAKAWLSPPRHFASVLRTNRLEGGLGETLGAYVATTQGKRAISPTMRSLMSTIGREESGHARLSRSIHEWGQPKLTTYQNRALVRDAAETRSRLSASHEHEHPQRGMLGAPSATEMQARIKQL